MPGNWGHRITLQRNIIKVEMHENTSEERNQFPLLMMEMSSNLEVRGVTKVVMK